MVVRVLNPIFRKKPFIFFEFWMMHPAFTSIVRQVWESPVVGHPMFILMCKLKMLKWHLKELNREAYSDIFERTAAAREALRVTQLGLQQDPGSITLAELEKSWHRQFVELRSQEESFYEHKSRVRWLQQGDRNTKFFHHSVKRRQLRNKILSVKDPTDSLISDPALVPPVFVSYFSNLLMPQTALSKPSLLELKVFIRRCLFVDQVGVLSCPILTPRSAILFFLWPVIKPLDQMVLQLNSIRAIGIWWGLWPIACYNTIYKIITKILANRLAIVLNDLISPPQNAFVKSRRITDNILLAQELFAGFHLDPYFPKCAIKVDFQKT
ncbi:uncharacterized protein LOC120292468 [Eucalyptus grandis]|uniref:uncharacterized protein LOC120292468 n=1 Tax=Eucalyptus grandis TaxID=71139 RepID=UPI00192EBAC1|nr:uncharacterized protein LOC120292468 [Eucalyptus grandis]